VPEKIALAKGIDVTFIFDPFEPTQARVGLDLRTGHREQRAQ